MPTDQLTIRELFEELLDNRQLSLRLSSEEEARYVYSRISSFRSKWNKRLLDLGAPADAGILRFSCGTDEVTGECIASFTFTDPEERKPRYTFRIIRQEDIDGTNVRSSLEAAPENQARGGGSASQ